MSCKCGISGLSGTDYNGDWIPDSGGGYGQTTVDTSIWNYPIGNPSTPGAIYSGASPSGGSNWLTALTAGIKGATGILGARYSVPQLNPGQLIQTGPNGQSLMFQGTAGNMSSFPNLANMGSSLGGGSMLPLLAVGAVVLFMMKK